MNTKTLTCFKSQGEVWFRTTFKWTIHWNNVCDMYFVTSHEFHVQKMMNPI